MTKLNLLGAAVTTLGSMILLAAEPAIAISADSFSTTGEGGEINEHSFTVGPGGSVFDIEAYLNVSDNDLNGSGPGSSGRLGNDDLSDFDIAFSSTLSDGDTDITLTYAIEKASGSPQQVTFLSFLDAEIDVLPTTWYGEFARTGGTLAAGQNFEVDEPGAVFGNIIDNIFSGELDGSNTLDESTPDDVSMAISLELGSMAIGDSASVEVMISEDGDHVGSFWITHLDAFAITGTEITFSATASTAVDTGTEPEPTATPDPTPVADADPAPVADADPTPVADADPTPVADADPAPVADADPTPVADADPAPVADADPTPVADADPTPVADADPTPVAAADPMPLSMSDPTPISMPTAPSNHPTAAIPEPSGALVFALGVLFTSTAVRRRR